MAYTTIDFDSFTQDDWELWGGSWCDCIDSDDDIVCPTGEWDCFFREGSMPADRDTREYWDFLVCKYWDFLCEEEEERYTNSFDVDEDCWMHMSREQSYDPRYARSY